MQNRLQDDISPIEKIIAALSYITFGFVGFVWLVLALITKNRLKPYLKYHLFQSLFIAFAYFLFGALLGLLMNILSIIPFINQLVLRFTFYLNAPIILGFSLIQTVVYLIIGYLVVTCMQGKLSYLPWFSDIIKANVRNS